MRVSFPGAAVSHSTADHVLTALTGPGFFYAQHPRLTPELLRAVKGMGKQFLTSVKRDSQTGALAAPPHGFRGCYRYVGVSGSTDEIECFSVGRDVDDPLELRAPYFRKRGYPEAAIRAAFANPNPWPQAAHVAAETFNPVLFRSTMVDYFDACEAVSMDILRHVAAGLGLSDGNDFFTPFHRNRDHNLEVKLYPRFRASTADDRQGDGNRLDVHKDLSSVTLLAQDVMGGLEVLDARTDEFVAVPSIDDGVCVNAGGFLEEWTSGVVRATPHRVRAVDTAPDRCSVVFFCFPDHDAIIEPFALPGDAGGAESFSAGDMMPSP